MLDGGVADVPLGRPGVPAQERADLTVETGLEAAGRREAALVLGHEHPTSVVGHDVAFAVRRGHVVARARREIVDPDPQPGERHLLIDGDDAHTPERSLLAEHETRPDAGGCRDLCVP